MSQNFTRTNVVASIQSPLLPGGRLTLTSATPVMSSTVNDATSIYYALYVHDKVPLYDGTNWNYTTFTELTNTTTDSTKNPAAVGASSNYDLFVWSDSGTIRLGRGPAWTSDTARGTGAGTTELERVNGVWVNKIAITNGPAAQRGTYVGTVRSASDSKIDWQLAGTDTPGLLNVWNMYNRVVVSTKSKESTNSWTYSTTGTWRAYNNSTNNRVSYVCGLAEDALQAVAHGFALIDATAGGNPWVGIGYDAVNAISGSSVSSLIGGVAGATFQGPCGGFFETTSLGFHFLSMIEYSNGATQTFYGDLGFPAFIQSGFTVTGKF